MKRLDWFYIISGLASIASFIMALLDKFPKLKIYFFIAGGILILAAIIGVIIRFKNRLVVESGLNPFFPSKMKRYKEKTKLMVMQNLYDAHHALLNTSNTPVSARILETDLGIDKVVLIDLLKELKEENKIELIERGLNNFFARIITVGIKEIENRR